MPRILRLLDMIPRPHMSRPGVKKKKREPNYTNFARSLKAKFQIIPGAKSPTDLILNLVLKITKRETIKVRSINSN